MELRPLSKVITRTASATTPKPSGASPSAPEPPLDEVALNAPAAAQESAAATANPATPAAPPAGASREQLAVNQQVAGQLLTEVGSAEFKRMAQLVPSQMMPAFKTLGEAANRVAQGSQADLYYHLSQNVHHFGVAHENTVERMQLGSEQPKSEILAEEMKVQAEALALLPYATPQLLAEVEEQGEGQTASPDMSRDAHSLALIKQRLAPEQLAQAAQALPAQPLFQAARPELLGEANFGTELSAMQDVANDFLPVATGLRSLYFRSAHGSAQPSGPELINLADQHGAHFFSEHGPLARVSPGLQRYAEGLSQQQPDILGRYRAGNNVTTLLLAMDAGSNDFYTAQSREPEQTAPRQRYQHAAVQQLVLQQGLMETASPMLIQTATNPAPEMHLEQQYHAESAKGKLLNFSASTRLSHDTEVIRANTRLIHLISEQQAEKVLAGLADHPLAALQEQDLSKLEADFRLPFAGSQRARASLAAFGRAQTAFQSALVAQHSSV